MSLVAFQAAVAGASYVLSFRLRSSVSFTLAERALGSRSLMIGIAVSALAQGVTQSNLSLRGRIHRLIVVTSTALTVIAAVAPFYNMGAVHQAMLISFNLGMSLMNMIALGSSQ
jgi:hypothetical protein